MVDNFRNSTSKEPNALFIRYLNSLHNVNADNASAYTEMSITSPFFNETMVERGVGNYIQAQLVNNEAHLFILTGHAGDGKTALLYQALKTWGVIDNKLNPIIDVTMPNGRTCKCIKDFSELETEKRKKIFQDALDCPGQGISVFLVANTGPLIATATELCEKDTVTALVGAIDDNTGEIHNYNGIPIATINVAAVDNSTFVAPYLSHILGQKLWDKCENCSKKCFCPIYMNFKLMSSSKEHISEFISRHYIWQQEHGNKLTIRQIVAHLAYTITGGLNCNRVKDIKGRRFIYLCSNQFFGYNGVSPNLKATSVKAISDIIDEGHDQKRIRADEELFIKNDYSSLPIAVQDILNNDGIRWHQKDAWQQAVRRAYIFLNEETDSEKIQNLWQDIFSTWYPRYLELRSGNSPIPKDKDLILDALKMLFLGSLTNEAEIPITMRRDESNSQCVQLVYDNIQKKNIKLVPKIAKDFDTLDRYKLYISIKGTMLNTPISLPLMNHFEEMRHGALQTNIDPQLSQGIDSLRAQLISLVESDDTDLELRIVSSDGWDSICASYDAGTWTIE